MSRDTRFPTCLLIGAVLSSLVFSGSFGQEVNPANGHTYFMTDEVMGIYQARAQAQMVHGHVVCINDLAEDQ